MAETAAIILAAGGSTRMNTKLAKVLHEVCGRSMFAYVLDACRKAAIKKVYVIVGFGAEQVQELWLHKRVQMNWVGKLR